MVLPFGTGHCIAGPLSKNIIYNTFSTVYFLLATLQHTAFSVAHTLLEHLRFSSQ